MHFNRATTRPARLRFQVRSIKCRFPRRTFLSEEHQCVCCHHRAAEPGRYRERRSSGKLFGNICPIQTCIKDHCGWSWNVSYAWITLHHSYSNHYLCVEVKSVSDWSALWTRSESDLNGCQTLEDGGPFPRVSVSDRGSESWFSIVEELFLKFHLKPTHGVPDLQLLHDDILYIVVKPLNRRMKCHLH